MKKKMLIGLTERITHSGTKRRRRERYIYIQLLLLGKFISIIFLSLSILSVQKKSKQGIDRKERE